MKVKETEGYEGTEIERNRKGSTAGFEDKERHEAKLVDGLRKAERIRQRGSPVEPPGGMQPCTPALDFWPLEL